MYEIAQWNGKQELAELDNTTISIDPILLNDAILKLNITDHLIQKSSEISLVSAF